METSRPCSVLAPRVTGGIVSVRVGSTCREPCTTSVLESRSVRSHLTPKAKTGSATKFIGVVGSTKISPGIINMRIVSSTVLKGKLGRTTTCACRGARGMLGRI